MVYLNCRKGKGGEKMKNKKGFTLIELLAVIVILAIIALIATPIVLGIIEDSRSSAKVNSAQFMIDGVQTAYAVAYTKSYADDESTTDKDETKVSGEVPTLVNIKEEIDFKNAEAVINAEGALVITSKDGVVCTFTVAEKEGVQMLSSDNCNNTEGITATEIGEVGTAKAIAPGA